MCGIAGILTPAPVPDAAARVMRMQHTLRHRGPDGCGVWLSPSHCASLAHVRLAIFDRSDAAGQPLSIDDGRFTVTYNGAIYNCGELRCALQKAGDTFRTASDTEVIVRAYQRFGAACVDRLRGMFAFVIWDEVERTAFLARDPLGIKPLYYSSQPNGLAFASELRAIAAAEWVPNTPDGDAVYAYFRLGSVPEPRTLLRGVSMLPAGAHAIWRNGTLTLGQPTPMPWESPAGAEVDPALASRRALRDSVERHFAGEASVGLLLSGGADSAAIAALARAGGRENIHAFSLAMPGSANDEAADAARTAKLFGLQHHVLAVDAATAKPAFEAYLQAVDQPTIDGFNTFVAARYAREHGIPVLLSGIGGDELFGGYPSFARVPRLARWHNLAAGLWPLTAWAGATIERVASGSRLRRLGDLLGREPSLANAYRTYRGIFTGREASRLAAHFTGAAEFSEEPWSMDHAREPADAVGVMEMTHYMRNQLLRDADVMGMAAGVEVRTPFVDVPLARTVWAVPAAVRLQAGKRLLAEAVPEIPAWAWAPPKRCFQLPIDRWFDGEWRGVFADVERRSPVSVETWYRKWCIGVFEQSMVNIREARQPRVPRGATAHD